MFNFWDVDQAKQAGALEQGAAPSGGAASGLRGRGYDEQVALLAPAGLAPAAPETAPPAAEPPSKQVTDLLAILPELAGGGVAPAAAPAAPGPTLRRGSNGDEVVRLQSLLNHTDEVSESLAVDGIFGGLTDKAVRQFQAAHPPLACDGIVGPMTWGALSTTPVEPQDPTAVAKKLFDRGARAYDRGQFAHAYDFFTSADEHVHRPGLTFSRAQCLRKLGGRRPEAIALYEQYLAEGGGDRAADAQAALVELRGPGRTGNEAVDTTAARACFDRGAALYDAGQYAHAYDEFTKGDEASHRPGFTFSRAQSLRRLGGRREEAIALYEQYLSEGDGTRNADAMIALEELRTPTSTGDVDADTAVTKALFAKGAAAYDAGDYAHAYDEFTKADELMHRSGLTFSRAQCLRKLGGRREKAIELYGQYIAEGGDRSDEARFNMEELRTQGALDPAARL
ncbi:MAG: peptidoglycan-binding domain-containing protein [Myxococcota bacterium]